MHGWLLLLPAAALLALFTHYPVVATFFHSFFSTPRGSRGGVFVGLDNYRQMLDDPIFWQALTNNAFFALGTIPVSIGLALLMAIWVNGRIAGKGWLRLAYFTPTVLPMIAVANIWLFFYTPQYGLLEQILSAFGVPSHNFLGSKDTVLSCLIVVAIWKEAGFFMIFYLAALQQMSPNLAEAAAIEGRVAVVLFPPRDVSAADADDAVRAGQRGHQFLPAGRPHRGDDQGRARQRQLAAALLHLRSGFQVLGFGLRRGAHDGAAGAARARWRSGSSCSWTARCITGEHGPATVEGGTGAGDRRRLAACDPVDPAAALCLLDGVPPAGIRDQV